MSEDVLRILLVEDNPGDADLLRETLAQVEAQLKITHVERLQQAVEYIKQAAQVDVILLDLGLPDSMGITTLERANREAGSLPIIVLTGLEDEDVGIEAVRKGAQDYLVKGQTRPRMLLRSIHHSIERKRMEKALETSMQRFYSTLSSMYGSIILVNNEGKVEFANQSFCNLFNLKFSPQSLVGLSSNDIIEMVKISYAHPEEAVIRVRDMVGRGQPVKDEEVSLSDGRTCLRDYIPINLDGQPFGRLWHHIDITDRKRTEKALRERERLLQDVMDGSTSPIFLKDRDGKFIAINASLEKMLGKSREEIIGKSDYDIAPKEVADYWRATDKKVMATGKAIQIEEAADLMDGRHIFLANKFPLVDADGQTYGLGAISHDITDRKRAEEAIASSEREFRLLAESMPQIVWTTRADGWTTYFNHQWLEYTGLTLEESYGHGWNKPFHPDDQQRAWDAWRSAVNYNAPYFLQCRLRRADGVYRWWLIHGVPVLDENGNISKWFGTCTDIDDMKQAEEALLESEKRFRTMAELIPQLSWMAQPDGHIFWYNRRWYEYTGTTPEQMEGWGWQSVHDPAELPRVLERWKAALAAGEPWEDTFPLRRHDGAMRWHLSRAMPICDGQGRVVKWFGTNTDITERMEMEKVMQQAKEAAEAANEAKSQFLANMSHELRTPMNAILGMIDVALQKATDATVQDCLQTAKGSADLLLTLLNDLLDSSKIESGKLELESVPFSLRRMLGQITRGLAVRASEKGLYFYCRLPDDTPDALVGDRMRLQQVLLNLAGNSIKFTDRGEVEIGVRAQSQDGEVCLEFIVRDTGIGIPPSNLEHLFQPFVQADASMARRFGGTGLGLSICKRLVELMGGCIRVDSELGKGSTFYFDVRLPLAKELPSDFELPVALPTAACGQLRILLVEDNPPNQKLATYILQDRGHVVEIACDGQEAVSLTQENNYDVILMDVQMPGMNGLEATAAIRKREAEKGMGPICAQHPPGRSGKLDPSPFPPRLPIIAMTAHAMKSDRDRCLAAGMDGYLSKPVNAQEMIGLIESLACGALSVVPHVAAAPNSGETSHVASLVFNPEEALTRCFNSRGMVREIIQCFFDDVDNLFPQMRAALEKNDLVEVGRLGHRMKGTIIYLGAQQAKETALAVERFERHGGAPTEADEAINAFERECRVLKAALADYTLAAEPKQDDSH